MSSRALGDGTKDQVGWNRGLYELATGSEVLGYFDQVLHQKFLPSGRVQYYSMCEYLAVDQDGTHRFRSLVSGDEFAVEVRKKLVDATYMNVTVPSMRPPAYEVAPGVRCVPPNELTKLQEAPSVYGVVGAGKTGMDACLWLLANGVDPASIVWIMPRDSWLLDRANIQPGAEFFETSIGGLAQEMELVAESKSIDDLFEKLEARGRLLRLDKDVQPTMYRCATVTVRELEQLRRIENVVRLGRVQRLLEKRIELEHGSIPTSPDTLYIDCTADGLAHRPVVPVFDGERVNLQSLRTCQQVFSAALIAHVEAAYEDDATKSDLCTVVQHPNSDVDWLRSTIANSRNGMRWSEDEDLSKWLSNNRLNVTVSMLEGVDRDMSSATLERLRASTPRALERLEQHLAEGSRT